MLDRNAKGVDNRVRKSYQERVTNRFVEYGQKKGMLKDRGAPPKEDGDIRKKNKEEGVAIVAQAILVSLKFRFSLPVP